MTLCEFCGHKPAFRDDLDELTLCDPCLMNARGTAGEIAIWLRVHVSGEWLSTDPKVQELAFHLGRLSSGTLRADRSTCPFCYEPWPTHTDAERVSCERDLHAHTERADAPAAPIAPSDVSGRSRHGGNL